MLIVGKIIPMASLDITFSDLQQNLDSYLQVEKQWYPLYVRSETENEKIQLGNAVIAIDKLDTYMEQSSWDDRRIAEWCGNIFNWGITYCENDEEVYDWSYPEKLKPVLYSRQFYGLRDKFFDVIEEFKIHNNLYQKNDDPNFYTHDRNGEDFTVIKCENGNYFIRKSFLNDYLYKTKQVFIITFSLERHSSKTLQELGLKETRIHDRKIDNAIFFQCWIDSSMKKKSHSFAQVQGKKFFLGKKVNLFEEQKENLDFIVDLNEDGEEIRINCKEENGENKMIPIFFNKEVLDKYHSDDRCIISAGFMKTPAWYLQIDNDSKKHVVVYLYKLAGLPTIEQRHWQSHNIPKEERKMSATFFQTTILGQPAYPASPIHVFKILHEEINNAWLNTFLFPLFKEPHGDDRYVFPSLKSPSNDSHDLDSQMHKLSKLLVDFIDESVLEKKFLQQGGNKEDLNQARSIKKLELFLELNQSVIPEPIKNTFISCLRLIQETRSSSIHGKGSNYDKLKTKYPEIGSDKTMFFNKVLKDLNSALKELIIALQPKQLA